MRLNPTMQCMNLKGLFSHPPTSTGAATLPDPVVFVRVESTWWFGGMLKLMPNALVKIRVYEEIRFSHMQV